MWHVYGPSSHSLLHLTRSRPPSICQGEIIGFALSGFLVSTSEEIRFCGIQVGGWPSAFYVFSLIGIVWTPFYAFAVYSSPEQHPTITKEEINIIRNSKQHIFYHPRFLHLLQFRCKHLSWTVMIMRMGTQV
jgi:hypothetical protein